MAVLLPAEDWLEDQESGATRVTRTVCGADVNFIRRPDRRSWGIAHQRSLRKQEGVGWLTAQVRTQPTDRSNYPPAEPEALGNEPLKAALKNRQRKLTEGPQRADETHCLVTTNEERSEICAILST
jgi:hypothetical protein